MDDQGVDIATENVSVDVPANMLAQIDALVGGGFVDRQEFIRAAIRHYLEYQELLINKDQGAAGG